MAAVRAFVLSSTVCSLPQKKNLPGRLQEEKKSPALIGTGSHASPARVQQDSVDRRSVLLGAVLGGALFFQGPAPASAARRKTVGEDTRKKVDNNTKDLSAYDQRLLAKKQRKADLDAKVAETRARAAKEGGK